MNLIIYLNDVETIYYLIKKEKLIAIPLAELTAQYNISTIQVFMPESAFYCFEIELPRQFFKPLELELMIQSHLDKVNQIESVFDYRYNKHTSLLTVIAYPRKQFNSIIEQLTSDFPVAKLCFVGYQSGFMLTHQNEIELNTHINKKHLSQKISARASAQHQFNLLPWREHKLKRSCQLHIILLTLFFTLLAVCYWYYHQLNQTREQYHQSILTAQNEIDKLLEQRQSMNYQLDINRAYTFSLSTIHRLLTLIQQHIPEGNWLTEIDYSDGSLAINGKSFRRTEIDSFYETLALHYHPNFTLTSEENDGIYHYRIEVHHVH